MKTENFGTFLHTDHKNCYYCVKTNIFPESSTTAALLSHVPTQNFSSQILRSVSSPDKYTNDPFLWILKKIPS